MSKKCKECGRKPALDDARFGGRCYDCAGRPMQAAPLDNRMCEKTVGHRGHQWQSGAKTYFCRGR